MSAPAPPSRFSVSDIMYGTSDCRRAWWLSRTWDVKRPILPFFVGNIVHKGLEIFYSSRDSGEDRSGEILKQTEIYANRQLIKIDEDLGTPEFEKHREDLEEAASRGVKVVANYLAYSREFPLEGKVLDVEKKFALPVEKFVLSGRIDLIIERHDGVWIVDHKTSAGTFNDRGIDLDEQVTAYLWAAQKIYGMKSKDVRGIIFNSLRSAPPEAPYQLRNGKAVKLSKAKSQSTTHALYLEEIERLCLDPSEYSEFLQYLQETGWGMFFSRLETSRNEHEIRSFDHRVRAKLRTLESIVSEPEEWAYPSPSIYRCPNCQFLSVCKSIEDGSDWEFQLESGFIRR